MQLSYKTVYTGGSGEIVEKKSRFIATIIPVKTEDEALAFIEQMKKKYWDARHNCSAYTIGLQHELARCSDDGEPAKTAGRPMLDVLLNEDLHNVCVVVTRYFGGTLLGTGGLVRAYQGAVKEGLLHCSIITKEYGIPVTIHTDYTGIGKIQYITAQMELTTLSTEYTEQVSITVLVTPATQGSFLKKVTEATSARAQIEEKDPVWFASFDGEVLLFTE